MSTTAIPLPTPAPEDWFNPDPEPQATQPPAAPTPPSFFLQAETGTVYKTAEEAAKGVAEKDRLIVAQRQQLDQAQRLLQAQGIQVGGAPSAPQTAPFYKALETSVQRGDMSFDEALNQAMDKMWQEKSQQYFQPLQPLMEYASLERAALQASAQYDPNIAPFMRSKAYQQELEARPVLRDLIQQASLTPQYQKFLPEMLNYAYEFAKTRATAAPAAQQRTAPASSTPPQMIMSSQRTAPQAPTAFQNGDPFTQAWSQVDQAAVDRFFNPGP
jgi:hypothetical protein